MKVTRRQAEISLARPRERNEAETVGREIQRREMPSSFPKQAARCKRRFAADAASHEYGRAGERATSKVMPFRGLQHERKRGGWRGSIHGTVWR